MDCLTQYLRGGLAVVPRFTREQEAAIQRRIKHGRKRDRPALREKLAMSQVRLVVAIAKRYSRKGVPFEELVAIGNRALMEVLAEFDPERGRLSTIVGLKVQHELAAAVFTQQSLVRLPLHLMTKTDQPLVATRIDRAQRIGSLNDCEYEPAQCEPEAEELLDREAERRQLASALACLSEREQYVVRGRLANKTLRQIGEELGISRQGVEQTVKRATARLRELLGTEATP